MTRHPLLVICSGRVNPVVRRWGGARTWVGSSPRRIITIPLLAGAPEKVRAALAASVPFPKRLGHPDEFAQLAETMITNGYFNGESVRLDGAIRMAPR